MTQAKQAITATRFYQFLGAHSFLIGLLPFFIPVYLWRAGFGLAQLSVLLGVSGLSFCAVLGIWQTIARSWPITRLIALTFVLELALIVLLSQLGSSLLSLLPLAIINGVYNAFFWTTQRSLFIGITSQYDTGRQYGNFQIFVTVFLKIGLLAGGLLLDAGGIHWLVLLSAIVGLASSLWFYQVIADTPLDQFETTNLRQSFGYKDVQHSRRIFLIDGLFLYLESHFWTLSLFLLVKQDYSRLGFTVVVLALVFSVLFFAIKNIIDKYSGAIVYSVAVVLYAASWILRAIINPDTSMQWILIALVLITFCSSFFRLAFNKRFFDIAMAGKRTQYLLTKSYVSQLVLGIGYLLLAATLFIWPAAISFFHVYLAAALLALFYTGYGSANTRQQ